MAVRTAGIDIGSRTTKLVVLEDGQVVFSRVVDTGTDPLSRSQELLKGRPIDALVATGYGRHLLRERMGGLVITEIKAHALGAHWLFSGCQTVIDIGGQDAKVIRLENGRQVNFEMNDRCAAGTGRFLEVMAMTLGWSLTEFGDEALKAREAAVINSMCTVFSESEVISLIARGVDKRSIARGLHEAIISRLMAMVGRVGVEPPVVFCGGVAYNSCIRILLERRLGVRLLVPTEPQLVGALGAALVAMGVAG
ncbi:MAG: acyl-CoA dehydratase activase [bacterium]